MRAVVTYKHGGLDQMVFEQKYPDPIPKPTDVILRMRACTLNYHGVAMDLGRRMLWVSRG